MKRNRRKNQELLGDDVGFSQVTLNIFPGVIVLCTRGVAMGYFCSECRQSISLEEYSYFMNRYHWALCRLHQRRTGTSGTTRDLQDLVRERHASELGTDVPVLRTVKDWIAADLETWEKVLKKEDAEETYIIKVSGEEKEKRKKELRNNK